MTRYTIKVVTYAPLYILSFQLVQPHTIVEAEKFNIQYTDPSQIDNMAEKLRWYRYKSGLLQKEVAEFAGLERSTYTSYEDVARDYYPIETMQKLAELFAIPVTELLDDFNLFLYKGQGKQIKALRERRNMTQKEYARRLGISLKVLKSWEQDRYRIVKSAWERLKQRG